MTNNFAIFILTHGRANKVFTYDQLIKAGYTGKVYIIIDNEDDQAPIYRERFGDKVIQFDKAEIAKTFDEGDNTGDRRAIVYARNACFDIARELNITYFMQLDDDYVDFRFKMDDKFQSIHRADITDLDTILELLLDYYKSIPAKSLAIAQGGDFIGGLGNKNDKSLNARRKCMNTFICSTERPFQFVGRINEDVNTYTSLQARGNLFLTFPLLAIQQKQSQLSKGGMTELYLDSGTYIKSFFSVMYHPSGVTVSLIGKHSRLHHRINWDRTAPAIIREEYKKTLDTLDA